MSLDWYRRVADPYHFIASCIDVAFVVMTVWVVEAIEKVSVVKKSRLETRLKRVSVCNEI